MPSNNPVYQSQGHQLWVQLQPLFCLNRTRTAHWVRGFTSSRLLVIWDQAVWPDSFFRVQVLSWRAFLHLSAYLRTQLRALFPIRPTTSSCHLNTRRPTHLPLCFLPFNVSPRVCFDLRSLLHGSLENVVRPYTSHFEGNVTMLLLRAPT